MRYHCVNQHDQRDCGAACVATLARDYGQKRSLAFYKNITKTDINGTTIYGLVEALECIGISAEAYEADIDDVAKLENTKLPIIARIINDEGQYHFIVINKIIKNNVLVSDPAKGKYKMRISELGKVYTGYIIVKTGENTIQREKEKSNTWLLFGQLLKKNIKIVLLISIASVFLTLLGIAFSLLIRYEFSTLEDKEQIEYEAIPTDLEELHELHEDGALSEDDYTYYYYIVENVEWIKDNFIIVIAFMCGAIALQAIFGYIKDKLYVVIVSRFEKSIMTSVTEKILKLPYSHLDRWKSGDLITRYSDAEIVADSVINISLSLLLEISMACVVGVMLYRESRYLFIVLAVLMLFYVVIVFAYIRPMKLANLKELEAETSQNSAVKEIVDCVTDIKACKAEKFNSGRINRAVAERIRHYKKARAVEIRQQTMISFSSGICNVLLLIVSFYTIIAGKMMISTYITFMALADYFINPIEALVNLQGSVQNGLVALGRLSDIVDDRADNTQLCDDMILESAIKVDNITFRYGNRLPVFDGYSCELPAKAHTVIMGENGCGKSTLAKILAGMYEPEDGQILFDDKCVAKKVIYLSQNSSILSMSIKDNITFGVECSEEKLDKVIESVCIQPFADDFLKGFDTVLEEKGRDLSSGQIQRIVIARALIREPAILILDEATSNIDLDTERKIYDNIRRNYPDMTLVSVVHKLNPNIVVDKIISM